MKKNLIKTILFSALSLLLMMFLSNNVMASSCEVCVYGSGSCVVNDSTDNSAEYGTICGGCGSGLTCARTGLTSNCSCQKTFGSGILSVGDTAGLSRTSVPQIVGSIIKVILGISGTVALIFIVWGGIRWMISQGDEKKITDARKLMTSGMIGIAIIAAAYAITDFVIKQITVVAGA